MCSRPNRGAETAYSLVHASSQQALPLKMDMNDGVPKKGMVSTPCCPAVSTAGGAS